MTSKILARIEAKLGAPGLTQKLIDLTPSDLQSLLLEVFRARSRKLSPADLLDGKDGLLTPSTVDGRLFHALDGAAFAAAPAFEAVELSPVGPIGANVVLGNIDQNSTLAALRNSEVLADPTVVMAIEAARRRGKLSHPAVVRLCASHRLIRMQPFDNPGFSRHFRLFALVTAGRDGGSLRFEADALREQLAVYLRLFQSKMFQSEIFTGKPIRFGAVTVELADSGVVELLGLSRDELAAHVRAHNHAADTLLAGRDLPLPAYADSPSLLLDGPARRRLQAVHDQLVTPLRAEFPDATFRYHLHRLEGATYYRGLCFRVNVVDVEGLSLPLADGGFTDWTQRLLNNAKERLLISGVGSEAICKRYR
jgi:hypothetical protein